MEQNNKNLCAICGLNEATTMDHLPPKSIFPRPRPNNLITVPSCANCNNTASVLDETFRLYLAYHVRNLNDEVAESYFQEARRTYEHNERLRREMEDNSEPKGIITESGNYAGEGGKILWNSEAHDATIKRTVRGLYFHHFGEILGIDVHVAPKWFNKPDQEFLNPSSDYKKNIIGDNQVIYFYGRVEEQPSESIWYFEFYGKHWAGAHTGLETIT